MLVGSSPRVRGKRGPSPHPHHPHRLIPACAGKTGAESSPTPPPSAHPRVCGENSSLWSRSYASTGSSPRVRGKRGGAPGVLVLRGLIPACAGKTAPSSSTPAATSAHPRVCGENLDGVLDGGPTSGSSPRVRGKQSRGAPCRRATGLIPACAGKTQQAAAECQVWPAHPRVCGENAHQDRPPQPPAGSSPRVRGKRAARPGVQVGDRLIPACAGKTSPGRQRGSRTAAHPRVCGENTTAVAARPRACGSSPRVRGKLARAHVSGDAGRLIPARAGKTPPGRPRPAAATAHPRVCGENLAEG